MRAREGEQVPPIAAAPMAIETFAQLTRDAHGVVPVYVAEEVLLIYHDYPSPTSRDRSNEGSGFYSRRSSDNTSLVLAKQFRRGICF